MKDLKEHLTESLNESAQDNLLKKLQNDWDRNNKRFPMDMSEMIEFAKKALESAKVKPANIVSEIGDYHDPDDLLDAIERGELSDMNEFLDEFSQILSDSDKYAGKEGDYADGVSDPWFLYDLMDYIDRFEK